MSQGSVCGSVFNEDIKGLFTTFVGNTNFGRIKKFLDRINRDRSMGQANHITFNKKNLLSMDFFFKSVNRRNLN